MKTGKQYVSWLVLCIFSLLDTVAHAQENVPPSYKGAKGDLHIYLLIGQSNMAGRAPFSEKESAAISNCYLLNNEDKWELAKNPHNRYSTIRKGLGMQKMGPGYSFSQDMLRNTKGVSIGLIVNAKGGSKIEQWKKGTKFYKDAIRRTQEAQKSGTLKGILWHQGESNADNPDGYLEKLTILINDLRSDLDAPTVPFVAGQVNKVEEINAQIAKLPKTVANTGYVSSAKLKTMDRWHFDTKSMLLLGKMYAEEIQKLQSKAKTKR